MPLEFVGTPIRTTSRGIISITLPAAEAGRLRDQAVFSLLSDEI